MQQQQSSDNTNDNDKRENQQPEVKLIWSVSNTATAIWIFLFGVFVLWCFLPDYVPDRANRAMVFIESVFSLAIVVVVVVHAMMYFKQAKAMDAQVNQTERAIKAAEDNVKTVEKTSIYANRAYITARIKAVNPVDQRLNRFYLRLRIENSGNTPANEVRVSYACGLRDKPPCEMVEGQLHCDIGFDLYKRLGVVAPNDSDPFIDTPEIGFDSIEDFRTFESEQMKFYCWGTIYYEDIFNEGRHSDFCFYQSWSRQEGYPCEYGNEAF